MIVDDLSISLWTWKIKIESNYVNDFLNSSGSPLVVLLFYVIDYILFVDFFLLHNNVDGNTTSKVNYSFIFHAMERAKFVHINKIHIILFNS